MTRSCCPLLTEGKKCFNRSDKGWDYEKEVQSIINGNVFGAQSFLGKTLEAVWKMHSFFSALI